MSWVLILLLLLLACNKDKAGDPSVPAVPDEPLVIEPPEIDLSPTDDLEGIRDHLCFDGERGCAVNGPYIEDTCCTYGDNLVKRSEIAVAEAVDVETDGERLFTCGGFGPAMVRPGSPTAAISLPRCQRIGIGEVLADGTQAVYFAHHGDSWVPSPTLWTARFDAHDRLVGGLPALNEPAVLYEGMDWEDGYLYVAAHAGGLRVYSTAKGDAQPTHVATLTGFDNALQVQVDGDHAYVIDQEDLRVVDVSDPTQPILLGSVATNGKPRDLDVFGDRVYVALGGNGLQVFDRSDPTRLASTHYRVLDGSVQSVKAHDDYIALANWSHMSLLSPDDLDLLATDKVRADFEQDYGVTITDDGHIFVAEWEGLHEFAFRQGYVAADLWGLSEVYTFESSGSSVDVSLTNRGPLELTVDTLQTTDPAWQVGRRKLTIKPGHSKTVTVRFSPPAQSESASLVLRTNDPDELQNPAVIPLWARETGGIDVGDTLNADFGFLHPSGDVEKLRGNVLVLAYFALF